MKRNTTMKMSIRSGMILVLSALLLFIAACGDKSATSSPSPSATTAADQPASSSPAATEKPLKIRVGHALQVTDPRHIGVLKFKDLVEKNSGGSVTVDVFPNNQLGPEDEMLGGLQNGTLDMVNTATSHLVNLVPEFGVFDLPYLVADKSQVPKILDGEFGRGMLDRLQKVGIVGLSYWEAGFRNVYSKKPVSDLASLKGQKIRVPGNPVYTSTLTAMGAIATPMDLGEAFSAIQQGTLDGAENLLSFYYHSKHYEVAKNLTLTNHAILPGAMLISKKLWDTLSPERQKLIMDASVEAGLYERDLEYADSEAALVKLKEAGVTISKPDLAPYIEATRKVYDKYTDTIGADLMTQVKAMLAK
jgi:tripartite ATP-independent transporter DctP family solute receptor